MKVLAYFVGFVLAVAAYATFVAELPPTLVNVGFAALCTWGGAGLVIVVIDR